MANIIKPKRSESTGQTPTLSPGELAVNIADKKVWVANSSGTPVLIVDGNASISETDPVFSASAAFSITTTDVTNWNTAYGWGDHSAAGYLTTETDPVFSASIAAGITGTDTGNWNAAYGWGDHSTAGYLTTETDPTFTASAAYSITSTDTTNWNTAYGWGDHSVAGYLTTETDPVFTASDAAGITATDISNWNAKPDTVAVTSTGATITVTDNTVGGAISFNVETPQGIATTDSPTFAGLTAAGLVYPAADGTSGQVIVTDGAGNLSFATVSVSVALDDLTDVTITTVSNNDFLKYNSTSSQWENVAISTDDISEGTTNLYFTDARARAAISAGTGISYNSTTGEISATGGGGTPGGSNKEIQFNNSGAFGGTPEILYYDNSVYILSINQTSYNLTPLTIRGASSPSANLMQWLRVDNAIYGGISNFGELFLEYGTPLIFKGNTANSSSYIQIQAPANIPNPTFFTLPNGDGTSGQVLKTDGSGQLSFTDVITNLSGGSGGSIPYQSGASTTAMLANGTGGQILKANGGTSAPSWVAQSTLAVGTATNLAGGGGGQIPYQSAAGTTAMLAAGTAGQMLTSNGISAPTWGNVLPAGCIQMYGGATAPTGWLVCDGSAVSRTTYASLFAAIGTNFGSGNGSTTFNLPSFNRRAPVGAGGTGTATLSNTIGSSGGSETHTLTVAEMPTHNHDGSTGSAGSHYHTFSKPALSYVSPSGTVSISTPGGTLHRFSDADGVNDTDTAANHSHTINNAGSGSSHNNLQPSLVVNFIIKT